MKKIIMAVLVVAVLATSFPMIAMAGKTPGDKPDAYLCKAILEKIEELWTLYNLLQRYFPEEVEMREYVLKLIFGMMDAYEEEGCRDLEGIEGQEILNTPHN